MSDEIKGPISDDAENFHAPDSRENNQKKPPLTFRRFIQGIGLGALLFNGTPVDAETGNHQQPPIKPRTPIAASSQL